MPELGSEGQAKLAECRVLIIGAGGLGCPVAQYLAAAGIGTIGIVDDDIVELSNLQRQPLYMEVDQGKSKSSVAKKRLQQLNPEIIVNDYDERMTDKNAINLFSGYDIIVDGTDNFSTKFLICDTAVKTRKTVVYGAIQGFDGQVAVFDSTCGACYRCLQPQSPESLVMNCAEAGVIGAIAGITGSVQAMEVVKLIIDDASFSPLISKLWMIDARSMETRIIKIPKRPDCPACSKPAAEIIPQNSSPVCFLGIAEEIQSQSIENPSKYQMIDVRELHEWEAGHIAGALHLPLSVLQINPDIFSDIDTEKPRILYCQRGMRSKKAVEILLAAGFGDILSLSGGYEEWCALKEH